MYNGLCICHHSFPKNALLWIWLYPHPLLYKKLLTRWSHRLNWNIPSVVFWQDYVGLHTRFHSLLELRSCLLRCHCTIKEESEFSTVAGEMIACVRRGFGRRSNVPSDADQAVELCHGANPWRPSHRLCLRLGPRTHSVALWNRYPGLTVRPSSSCPVFLTQCLVSEIDDGAVSAILVTRPGLNFKCLQEEDTELLVHYTRWEQKHFLEIASDDIHTRQWTGN